jgi:NAD(P)-dependent dehydrogenase (short-subunit alcohol dehydrogenase family)
VVEAALTAVGVSRPHHRVTKAALEMQTVNLAQEVATTGVTANFAAWCH